MLLFSVNDRYSLIIVLLYDASIDMELSFSSIESLVNLYNY